MAKFINITNKKFNRLEAIRFVERRGMGKGKMYWLFKCECGNEKEIASDGVVAGKTKSCGCLNREPKNYIPKMAFKKGDIRVSREKNHKWKGGKPKCLNCDRKLSIYKSKTGKCFGCASKHNKRNWKGGISKLPYYSRMSEESYENKLAHNRRRRINKIGADGTHTKEQWQELKEKFNFMCLCCKQKEPFITLTEDHIVPLTKGGSDDIKNIQPLCRPCNSRKFTAIFDYIKFIQHVK